MYSEQDTQNNIRLERDFTIKEILFAIKKLKTGKAFGPDGIANELIKELARLLAPELCKIFNI